ncbi:MXAN_2562 family outer membrane beta-barrel protein [Nannocystaceae bacterium ST9]
MSPSLLVLQTLLCLAPPPPPPADAPPSDTPDDEVAPIPIEPGKQPGTPGVDDLPRDERYDPILPYGEARDPGEDIEYADETPPPPEIEYADETPPPPEIDYDQSHQRPAPADEAIEREGDEQDDIGRRGFQGRAESPQRFLIELKFGPYLPDIDRKYTGDGLGPYATVFGEQGDDGRATGQPKKGVFSVLGFEWQFYHLGGAFSLGTTIGLFRDKAQALQDEPDDEGNYRNKADNATFNVVPITVLLGYRFELLADRFRVPLVPYARAGLGYGFWWATKGGRGDISTTMDGQKTRGGSLGWQANLGLMLRLDFIDRASAVDLDRNTGVNHTYLFGEWQFSRLAGFGSDKRLSVGDDTFTVGFAVAF